MNEQVLYAPQKPAFITRPRITLLLISLLLIFASTFRLGLEVTVGEWTSTGVYQPRELIEVINATEAIASEILMENVSFRGDIGYKLKLTRNDFSTDLRGLRQALLEYSPAIVKLCAIKIDGEFIGWLKDPGELGEILETILAENSTPTTISANFTQKITAEYSYAPADTNLDIMAISSAIRNLCSVETVSWITEEGQPT